MSRTSQPTRIPADVYAAAAAAAEQESRTVPQQIAHWARIGRELERSPQVNHRAIRLVLAGEGSYDRLGDNEQALVRDEWATKIAALRTGLNYQEQFVAEGQTYSEADPDGNLVVHAPGPTQL